MEPGQQSRFPPFRIATAEEWEREASTLGDLASAVVNRRGEVDFHRLTTLTSVIAQMNAANHEDEGTRTEDEADE